ncbi:MAG: four helix bundle protein [Patescibacteria group bacterium]|mgnify:FL=1
MKYDLEERTVKLGEEIILLCKKVNLNTVNRPIVSQLVRSGTSIGANYAEANGASSKQDFRNKIFICRKEAQETRYWLRMLSKCEQGLINEVGLLLEECRQLILIFQKIGSTITAKTSKLKIDH